MAYQLGIDRYTGTYKRMLATPTVSTFEFSASYNGNALIPATELINAKVINPADKSIDVYLAYPEFDVIDSNGNNITGTISRKWTQEGNYEISGLQPGTYYLKVAGLTGPQGMQGIPGKQGEQGEPGEKGDTGDSAGFGDITASISTSEPDAYVAVIADGPDTSKNIHFNFNIPVKDPVIVHDREYYTAFEVYPHLDDIPAGDNDDLGYITDASITKANTVHRMQIRTGESPYTDSDIMVDWGDGTTSTIALGEFNTSGIVNTLAGTSYVLEHDYIDNLISRGVRAHKYIIRIYGFNYFSIMHRINGGVSGQTSNLMCRIMSDDLPIAQHVSNMVGFAYGAQLLTSVNLYSYYYRYFENCQYMFSSCKNLLSATGFGDVYTKSDCMSMFYNCTRLKTCDAKLALNSLIVASCRSQFESCVSLIADISNMIPSVLDNHGPHSMHKALKSCRKLTGEVPADKLWNNPDMKWSSTTECFAGCGSAILVQVPKSWGGSASDDIIDVPGSITDDEKEEILNDLKEYVDSSILNGKW